MAQRLVRTLCPHCKKPGRAAGRRHLARDHRAVARRASPREVMGPVGCLECRMTGYLGRIGLYEIMLMTPAHPQARRRATPTTRAIREQAYKDGMKPLRVSGAMKVARASPPPRK